MSLLSGWDKSGKALVGNVGGGFGKVVRRPLRLRMMRIVERHASKGMMNLMPDRGSPCWLPLW